MWRVGESSGPVRTCIGCRATAPAAELLRVVLQQGLVVPDPTHRLPGRGAYLHPELRCIETAVRRRAFARALRGQVSALPDAAELRAAYAKSPP